MSGTQRFIDESLINSNRYVIMRDFDVQFCIPSHGWMRVKVVAGHQEWHEDVSDVPCDSIRNLVSSLSMLVQGIGETTVDWSLEPEYAQWIFVRNGTSLDFVIMDAKKTNRQLVYRGKARRIIDRFIDALGKLTVEHCWASDDLATAVWSWPFPKLELIQLRAASMTAFEESTGRCD